MSGADQFALQHRVVEADDESMLKHRAVSLPRGSHCG